MKTQKFQWGKYATGKMLIRSGEQFVELLVGESKIPVPVDRVWESLKNDSTEEQVGRLSNPVHWITALPTMDISPEIKNRFFANFTKPEAIKKRLGASIGLKPANHLAETELVGRVLNFIESTQEIENGNRNAIHDPELMIPEGYSIGRRFAELIAEGNTPALRRIIEILENGSVAPPSQRGGLGSVEGEVLRQWCKLHVESRALPTWGDVRIACGFTQDEETIGRKAFGKFGFAVKIPERT
jgi:hypothetical protein